MITNGACENIGQPRFPRRRGDLSVEELDGEAVLYDPRNGAVHRFNATTFYVWNACDGSHTPQDVAITIADRYAVEAEDALKIVGGVVAQLSERGLLQNDHMFAHGGIESRTRQEKRSVAWSV